VATYVLIVCSPLAHPGTITMLASSLSAGAVDGKKTVAEEYLRPTRSESSADSARIWTSCGPSAAPVRSSAMVSRMGDVAVSMATASYRAPTVRAR
jgi:hypothetical protein